MGKVKNKNGISLIVLVITILVMIILAGVVIVTMSENNPINKAKEANFKSDIATFQEELSMHIANKLAMDSALKVTDIDAKGYDAIKKVVNSFTKKYENKIEVVNGEILYIGNDKEELEWATANGIKTNIEASLLPVPKLASSMTKIKWDKNKNEIEAKENWYDYTQNKWANAKTKEGSYYVWIPRYAYRIIYYANEADRNEAINYPVGDARRESKATGFSDVRGFVDKAGNLNPAIIKRYNIIETKYLGEGTEKYSYVENDKYMYDVTKTKGAENPLGLVVHPAFSNVRRATYNEVPGQNFGWDKEISGFWVSKYFMTETATGEFKSVPGVEKSRTLKVSEVFTAGQNLKNNLFNGESNIDTMNITNTQYGALNMLVMSKTYATPLPNSTTSTGGGTGEAFKNSELQSSTKNITGVYDISTNPIGWYLISACVKNVLVNNIPVIPNYMNTRFLDVYIAAPEDTKEANYNANRDKYGDYMFETTDWGDTYFWLDYPHNGIPLLSRTHLHIGHVPNVVARDIWRATIVMN